MSEPFIGAPEEKPEHNCPEQAEQMLIAIWPAAGSAEPRITWRGTSPMMLWALAALLKQIGDDMWRAKQAEAAQEAMLRQQIAADIVKANGAPVLEFGKKGRR